MPGHERLRGPHVDPRKSPALSNTFSNVTVLDRPPDRHHLIAKMQGAIRKVPRLHQRPVEAAGRLASPTWVRADFDLAHHLQVGQPPGGGADGASSTTTWPCWLPSRSTGRGRCGTSPWSKGCDGTAAMVQRMHHTITDGEGGIRLSVAFSIWNARRLPRRTPELTKNPSGSRGRRLGAGESDEEAESAGAIGEFVASVGDSVRRRGGQVVDAIGAAGTLLRNPGDAAEMARSTGRQVQVMSRCSPLWTDRSLDRWFGTTSLDLEAVKTAARSMGGTVNDFFVAGASHAAAQIHDRHGTPVPELRMSMPVSIRESRPEGRGDPMAGGNAFAPAQVMVPTDLGTPLTERFQQIHDRLGATRSEKALNALGGAAAVINLLPTAALLATGERATAGIDFVCSNVRAAPFDLYMGGALLEANYPVGPLAGTAFNLTTMSYRGTLWLGLHVDSGAVDQPEELLSELESAYVALFAAA
ncbi:MAG: WS/DGAT domain-containing protein [Microthrixaceae bacterium]